jgi:hypothetical protein
MKSYQNLGYEKAIKKSLVIFPIFLAIFANFGQFWMVVYTAIIKFLKFF